MAEAPAKPKPAKVKVKAPATPPDRRRRATRVQAATLRAALKDVAGIVETANTIPILGHVLVEVGSGLITLTASDLDIWASRELPSNDRDGPASAEWISAIRGFAVTLPASALAAILAEFDAAAMVTLEQSEDGSRVAVSAGRAQFRLACLPGADFPLPPSFAPAGSFELPCSVLADGFAAVEHAISTEETRYYLNGIFLHPHELDLRMATTDGHRMARLTLDGPAGAASFPPVIIARKTVALLSRLLGGAGKLDDGNGNGDRGGSGGEGSGGKGAPAQVLVEANQEGTRLRFGLRAGDGEIAVVAKMIDGSFPDYHRVIPSAPEHCAVIDRAALSAAIKRVAVLTSRSSRCIGAAFTQDCLRLSVVNFDFGEGSEEVPCSYTGPELTIGFNAGYWRQALAALDYSGASDEVAMLFSDARAPMLLRAGGAADGAADGAGGELGRLIQVLMPMRL